MDKENDEMAFYDFMSEMLPDIETAWLEELKFIIDKEIERREGNGS